MEVDNKPEASSKKSVLSSAVASSRSATPASGTRPGTPSRKEETLIPEVDIYLTLLVIIYLIDNKEVPKVSPSVLSCGDCCFS